LENKGAWGAEGEEEKEGKALVCGKGRPNDPMHICARCQASHHNIHPSIHPSTHPPIHPFTHTFVPVLPLLPQQEADGLLDAGGGGGVLPGGDQPLRVLLFIIGWVDGWVGLTGFGGLGCAAFGGLWVDVREGLCGYGFGFGWREGWGLSVRMPNHQHPIMPFVHST
jgi:hypothetical protein